MNKELSQHYSEAFSYVYPEVLLENENFRCHELTSSAAAEKINEIYGRDMEYVLLSKKDGERKWRETSMAAFHGDDEYPFCGPHIDLHEFYANENSDSKWCSLDEWMADLTNYFQHYKEFQETDSYDSRMENYAHLSTAIRRAIIRNFEGVMLDYIGDYIPTNRRVCHLEYDTTSYKVAVKLPLEEE